MEKMLGNTLWTWGTYWEPIENPLGTPWSTLGNREKWKKNLSHPPRNKNNAPWAFPLAERKQILLLPPAPNKTCMKIMKSPVSKWTFDHPLLTPNTAWKKNLPSNLPPKILELNIIIPYWFIHCKETKKQNK